MTDEELARDIAAQAGATLLEIAGRDDLSGAALGEAGDAASERFIAQRLRAARPGDRILSEEATDDLARCDARRVWIVDPLDGTREYSEKRADWAVHVALSVDGRPATGAIALPGLGRTLTGDVPPPPRGAGERLRMVVSRSRAPAMAVRVAEALGAELIPMGSAGAKAAAVVEGRADVYLHDGGQWEWDNCAPAAVALRAGLHASRIDGGPLRYNAPRPYLPDLLICRRELAEPVLAAVRAAR